MRIFNLNKPKQRICNIISAFSELIAAIYCAILLILSTNTAKKLVVSFVNLVYNCFMEKNNPQDVRPLAASTVPHPHDCLRKTLFY